MRPNGRHPTNAALALAGAVAFLLLAPAAAAGQGLPRGPLGAADYLAFADRLQAVTDRVWSTRHQAYANPERSARINAEMLAVHSLAALVGHDGPARRDERAQALVLAFTRPPAYRAQREDARDQPHRPGWSGALNGRGLQHVAVSSQVAEALALAFRARAALGLDSRLATRIRHTVRSVARSPFFRPSRVRLNQFVWHAALYAADAEVTGSPLLMRSFYRRVLDDFARHARRAPRRGWSSNLNSGLGFRYLPQEPPSHAMNRSDTAEYASLNLAGVANYTRAVRAGMRRLAPSREALLRRWAGRVALGSWTHGGYLNWDTGHGFRRWHLLRYWAWAQRGLIAIAAEPRIGGPVRPHAAAVLDESLRLYERWAGRNRALPSLAHGLRSGWANRGDAFLTAARFQGGALRAAAAGLGRIRKGTAVAVRAHDRDIGRLAVSTRRYSAAIVAPGPIRSGGADLSRLADGRGRLLAGPGGSGGARNAFGMRVSRAGRTVLETQPGAPGAGPRQTLARPDPGRRSRNRTGAFRRLSVGTGARSRAATVRVAHSFAPGSLAIRHLVRPRPGRIGRGLRAELRIPTARGSRVALGGGPAMRGGAGGPARRGMRLVVRTPDGASMLVTLARVPRGARLTLVRPRPTVSNRHPGPTILLRFAVRRGAASAVAIRPG